MRGRLPGSYNKRTHQCLFKRRTRCKQRCSDEGSNGIKWRIPGVIVKYVKLREASPDKIMVKWDGISALNNFQFEERGIRVWKAYKIGPGKLKFHGKTFRVMAVPYCASTKPPVKF